MTEGRIVRVKSMRRPEGQEVGYQWRACVTFSIVAEGRERV